MIAVPWIRDKCVPMIENEMSQINKQLEADSSGKGLAVRFFENMGILFGYFASSSFTMNAFDKFEFSITKYALACMALSFAAVH
mmetsp:Transcript_26121/g.39920  ORF Transcript_26121/g.39920 Transcript_26121/m.39920 type:complete len:84 (+) Transcript_26121:223-474(+)